MHRGHGFHPPWGLLSGYSTVEDIAAEAAKAAAVEAAQEFVETALERANERFLSLESLPSGDNLDRVQEVGGIQEVAARQGT